MESPEKRIRACLTQIYGESTTRKVNLKGAKVLIGRSLNADIRLKNINVSRKHCILTYTSAGWTILDNKSQNGTFVSGRKLNPSETRLLQCGDIIFLGPPSELPEAFCYDDALECDYQMDSDDEHLVSEVPTTKRPAELEDASSSKKKNSQSPKKEHSKEMSNAMFHEDIKNTQAAVSGKTKTEPSNSQESERKYLIRSSRVFNRTVDLTPVTSPSSVSPQINEADNGNQIHEISSTGDSQIEDSLSLLNDEKNIDSNGIFDPISTSNLSEVETKSSSHAPRASTENKMLKSKLASLSEQIKNLEKSKLDLIKNYKVLYKKNKSLDEQLAEQTNLKEEIKNCELKAKNEIKNELLEKFEEDLICNICTELLIKPIVLDCSHTFCKFCIKEWKKKKNECPMCRNKIGTMTAVITLEHLIDKTVSTLTPEQREKRDQMIKDREAIPPTPSTKRCKGARRQNRGNLRNRRAESIPSTSRGGDIEIISERASVLLPLPLPTIPNIPFYFGSNMNFITDSEGDIGIYVS